MMKIISVQNSKGGVGKTTLAINIAKYLSMGCNSKTVLYDADPQRTAYDWSCIKQDKSFDVIPIDNPKLLESSIEKNDYNYVVIDNPPAMSQFFITSIKLANYLVVPVASSAFDIWGLSSLIDTINMISKDFSIIFVHNKIIRNAVIGSEIKEALLKIEINKKNSVHDVLFRQSYPRSSLLGETVFDTDDSHAQAEIEFIVDEILK
jgi:chromosome partitioning protein